MSSTATPDTFFKIKCNEIFVVIDENSHELQRPQHTQQKLDRLFVCCFFTDFDLILTCPHNIHQSIDDQFECINNLQFN